MTEQPPDSVQLAWPETGAAAGPKDPNGTQLVCERYWTGERRTVCCVLVREPHTGLKAFIDGTESAWQARHHGARVDPELARAMFPAYASQKWATW